MTRQIKPNWLEKKRLFSNAVKVVDFHEMARSVNCQSDSSKRVANGCVRNLNPFVSPPNYVVHYLTDFILSKFRLINFITSERCM